MLREWRKGEARCAIGSRPCISLRPPATFVADEAPEATAPKCAPYADAGRNLAEAGFVPVFGGVVGGGICSWYSPTTKQAIG